jgi:hypothetical protein
MVIGWLDHKSILSACQPQCDYSQKFIAFGFQVTRFREKIIVGRRRKRIKAPIAKVLPMISKRDKRSPNMKYAITAVNIGSTVRIKLAVLEGSMPKLT